MEWRKHSKQPTGKPEKSTVTSSKVKKKLTKGQVNEKKEEQEVRGILASMRRLKIQEKLLETAAENCIDNQQLKSNIQTTNAKRLKETSELKESLRTVEALFDTFKLNISSLECIKNMDIEDYKKMVKELDDKFLSFKKYLNKELYTLKHAEINLIAELKQLEEELTVANTKTAVQPYTSVVPSPVKAIRNKPSVYPEVLKLQELLERSGGRRGGWGELEHASFVQCRRRCIKRHGCNFWLQNIVEILAEKIPGITSEEALMHEKWYREYSTLKSEQQAAIDRWKGSRDLARQQFRHFEAVIQDVQKHVQTMKSKSAPKKQNIKDSTISEKASLSSFDSIGTEELDLCAATEGKHPNSPEQESNLLPLNKNVRLCKSEKPTEEYGDKKNKTHVSSSVQNKESPKEGNSRNYMKPTKLWNLKTEKSDLGSQDFRLHIPMANAPKLGISDWRKCLIGQL